jgi:hypothetical protein
MPMPRRTCHDDYPLLAQSGHPIYGGLPKKLDPATLELAKSMLLAGQPSTAVAVETGFVNGVSFSRAFLAATGQRPGAWQRAAGVKRVNLRGGFGGHMPRKIRDRTSHTPLPRYKRRCDLRGSTGT